MEYIHEKTLGQKLFYVLKSVGYEFKAAYIFEQVMFLGWGDANLSDIDNFLHDGVVP
jgi:hypothetical protein